MSWFIRHAQHIGQRDQQQDRVAVRTLCAPDSYLCVVADGMGGHPRGADAAQAVVDSAADISVSNLDDPFGLLEQMIDRAHQRVSALGERPASPGSTCVAMLLVGERAFWAHVGDSRVYQIRNGVVIRTTEDHSLAALVAKRRGSAVPAVASNAVYRRLGSDDAPVPDYDAVNVRPDDILVLASDGFWNQFSEQDLVLRLQPNRLSEHSLDTLTQFAVRRAGRRADNATVLTARWQQTRPRP